MSNADGNPNGQMTNNLSAIPNEVEAATQRTKFARPGFPSRGETDKQFHGILRLRFALLRMTIRRLGFVIISSFAIRHSSFSS
jgi:hypothetical protein